MRASSVLWHDWVGKGVHSGSGVVTLDIGGTSVGTGLEFELLIDGNSTETVSR